MKNLIKKLAVVTLLLTMGIMVRGMRNEVQARQESTFHNEWIYGTVVCAEDIYWIVEVDNGEVIWFEGGTVTDEGEIFFNDGLRLYDEVAMYMMNDKPINIQLVGTDLYFRVVHGYTGIFG